jgi:hypothetical protein
MDRQRQPQFTAESSIYKTSVSYQSDGASHHSNLQVTPALFNITCYLNVYFRTYARCSGLGYGSGACSDVADGVAGSVCR